MATVTGSRKVTQIFLSFQHNIRDTFITDQIRAEFVGHEEDHLGGVRLMDDPEPGHPIPSSIITKVRTSDGVLGLWTPEAKRSFWVNFELYVAHRFAKPICLIRCESQGLPKWYGLRYAITLRGIIFRSPDETPRTDQKAMTGPNDFDGKFLRECLIFAARVRDHKADIGFLIPDPFGTRLRHQPNSADWKSIESELEAAVNLEFGFPDPGNEYPKGQE